MQTLEFSPSYPSTLHSMPQDMPAQSIVFWFYLEGEVYFQYVCV